MRREAVVVVGKLLAVLLVAVTAGVCLYWWITGSLSASVVAIVSAVAAVIAVLPLLWSAGSGEKEERAPSGALDRLASASLVKVRQMRVGLLGTHKKETEPANTRFSRPKGMYQAVGSDSGGNLKGVLDFYQNELSLRRLVILGAPGAGKTVLALELQVKLLRQFLEQQNGSRSAPVPVLVSAAAVDPAADWGGWLADHLVRTFSIGKQEARKLVDDFRVLPVIDGLDEMDAAGEKPERAEQLVDSLNSWVQYTDPAPVVVTCRRDSYDLLPARIERAVHIELEPLAGTEAALYLQRRGFRSEAEEQRWAPVVGALMSITPWRLTMAWAAARDGADPALLLPPDAAPADGELVDAYVKAAVNLRGNRRYQLADVKRWLTVLADDLAWQEAHEGSGTDIDLSLWQIPSNSKMPQWLHMTVAAVPVLPWLLPGVTSGFDWLFNAFISLAAFLPTCAKRPVARRASRRSLNFKQVDSGQLVLRPILWKQVIFGAIAVGAAGSLTRTWTANATYGHLGIAAVLILLLVNRGIIGKIAGSSAQGLAELLADITPHALGPRDVIRSEGRYILVALPVLAILAASAAGLAYVLRDGHAAWSAAGFMAGGAAGTVIGSSAWVRYHLTAALNAARGRAPLHFGAFLDWAHDAGLLRICGVTYQFRHHQLQEHAQTGR